MAMRSSVRGSGRVPDRSAPSKNEASCGRCENIRPEDARTRVLTDPHASAKYRVKGVLSNMPGFQKAFACKAGDAMVW